MSIIKKMLWILTGSVMISIGINYFIIPYNIIDGGMLGIALILNYTWNVSVGIAITLLSVPIFIMVWFYHRPFVYNNLVGMALTIFFIDSLGALPLSISFSPVIHAVVGGCLIGAGIAIFFLDDISTDTLDLLAQCISDFSKTNVGVIIFFFDIMVVGAGWFILSQEEFILSLIAITAHGFTLTLIVQMFKRSF